MMPSHPFIGYEPVLRDRTFQLKQSRLNGCEAPIYLLLRAIRLGLRSVGRFFLIVGEQISGVQFDKVEVLPTVVVVEGFANGPT